MTLIVETPDVRPSEWAYILDVVLRDWLGLDFQHTATDRSNVCIGISGSERKLLICANFLSMPSKLWLDPRTLPKLPLRECNLTSLKGANPEITCTPVIYGSDGSATVSQDRVELPLDIFGSAFFSLTRYEEFVRPERDQHDRFPASASTAHKAALLERPIIDEYCEILWRAIEHLWPGLKRRTHHFQALVSHDVDAAGKYCLPLIHI